MFICGEAGHWSRNCPLRYRVVIEMKKKFVNIDFENVFALLAAPNRAKLTLMVERKPINFCFILFCVTLQSSNQRTRYAQYSEGVRRKRQLKAVIHIAHYF